MMKTKRLLGGIAFAAILALSLVASGGDAYAKVKSSGGNVVTNDTTTSTPAPDIFQVLGVTWEE
jgi:hypothetical protein